MGSVGAGQEATPDVRGAVGQVTAFALFALMVWADPAVGADAALGQYLAGECMGCHQLSGRQTGGIPRITGLPESEFIAALAAYKTGSRDNPVMRNIAGRLNEEEMAALAAFFAARKQP